MKGMAQLLGILILLVTLFLTFAMVALFTMRFERELNTYMPFRTAVLVSHVLSGSASLAKTEGGIHKNLLDAAKLDKFQKDFDSDYGVDSQLGRMPPDFATLCYHWRAEVVDLETKQTWKFGRPYWYDMPKNVLGAIANTPATAWKQVEDDPFSALTKVTAGAATGAAIGSVLPGLGTAVGAGIGAGAGALTQVAEGFASEVQDLNYAAYSLPVNVVNSTNDIHLAALTVFSWRVKRECAAEVEDLGKETLEEKIWRRHDELIQQRFG